MELRPSTHIPRMLIRSTKTEPLRRPSAFIARPQIRTTASSLSPLQTIHTTRTLPFVCSRCLAAQRRFAQCKFSSTARSAQAALLNPRYNEEGEEMVLEITPRAAHRLAQIREKDRNPKLALRVTVESGGCHGFQYLMSLTDLESTAEQSTSEDGGDTVFEGRDGAKIVLDESSLELLHGSKVDYTMELIGSQFKITGNPRASSSCGCGTSFDVKMD